MKTILYLFLFFYFGSVYSQEFVKIKNHEFKAGKGFRKAKKKINYGDHFYKMNNTGYYQMALEYFLAANSYNSENAELNYKIGVCYIYSVFKHKSLQYFEKSYQLKKNVTNDILFQLAKAYQLNYKFEDAILFYNLFINQSKNENLITDARKKKLECEYGLILLKDTIPVLIENLNEINTQYPEYEPLIVTDQSVIYFTSRRRGASSSGIANSDFLFYEDVFFAQKDSGLWLTPKPIKGLINTPYHDAAVGISPDGQTLITYFNGDLHLSFKKGDSWTKPEPLPKSINSRNIENSACFSYDMNTIYFIRGKNSNPEKSNGDIWFSTRIKNNQWTEAQSLSETVNSKYDEDGVFAHPDGKTLYFSSKGHNSMGGYDIFKTIHQNDGTWSIPQNLGYPINTPDDDIHFVLAANGRTGYYSAVKDDTKGYSDIYRITFLNYEFSYIHSNEDNLIGVIAQPVNEIQFDNSNKLVLIKGKIFDASTGKPIAGLIEIIDNTINRIVYVVQSNELTGEFLVSLPPGKNYGVIVKKDGYLFHSENFDLSVSSVYQEFEQEIKLSTIERNAKIILRNIFFDYGKSELKKESISELYRIQELLASNTGIRIEISGHTDNVGDYDYNIKLSELRAKSVIDFLVNNGIEATRLSAVGFGFMFPISGNDTEADRQLNRRVEFKIIDE